MCGMCCIISKIMIIWWFCSLLHWKLNPLLTVLSLIIGWFKATSSGLKYYYIINVYNPGFLLIINLCRISTVDQCLFFKFNARSRQINSSVKISRPARGSSRKGLLQILANLGVLGLNPGIVPSDTN